jgi:hypothetical protein
MFKKHKAQIVNGNFVLGNLSSEMQKRIACPYCSVSYSYVKSVKRHTREKHPKRSLNFTPRVITSYIKKSKVSSRTKSSIKIRPAFSAARSQLCNECPKYFTSTSALKRHNLRILDYKCEFCGYRFFRRDSYRLRVERRHKDGVVHHDLIALNDERDWNIPPRDPLVYVFFVAISDRNSISFMYIIVWRWFSSSLSNDQRNSLLVKSHGSLLRFELRSYFVESRVCGILFSSNTCDSHSCASLFLSTLTVDLMVEKSPLFGVHGKILSSWCVNIVVW